MEIIQICGNLIPLGDIGVVLVLGAGDSIGIAYSLGLYQSLVGPHAGIQVSRLVLKVIHCDIEELQGSTAAQKYNLVGIRDVQEFLPEGAGFIHHGVPFLCAVGNAEKADAGAAEILKCGNGIVNGHLRQQAGPCIEYVYFFGHDYLWLLMCY